MNCRDFQDALQRARDERLPADDARALAGHAAECAGCARAAQDEERLRQALAKLRAHAHSPAPLGFEAAVLRRIAAPRQHPWSWPVVAAAALAASTLVGAVVLRVGPAPPPERSRAMAPASAPHAGTNLVPVTWSNGEVDVMGPAQQPLQDKPVAVVVEWNL